MNVYCVECNGKIKTVYALFNVKEGVKRIPYAYCQKCDIIYKVNLERKI